MYQYAYLILSSLLLAVWFILYWLKPVLQRQMFRVSFWTMWLALTEPLFVPRYWSPPTLFGLARQTGFDLESFIFCFAVGGIALVCYEAIFRKRLVKMPALEHSYRRHRLHFWVIISAPLVFLILLPSPLNPIYAAIIALVVGFFATWFCRPDLVAKMFVSGFVFLGIYFMAFLGLELFFPGYVKEVWNIGAISGIFFLGVPAEEMLWAFSFGLYWSSAYEHLGWYKLRAER